MNELTVNDLVQGERVFFFAKPHDKQPACITKVENAYEDYRGYGYVELEGIDMTVPVYQVKKIPEGFVNINKQ